MSDSPSVTQWLRETWTALLGLGAGVVVIALITAAAVAGCRTPWVNVSAVWPDRLSADVSATLPISISTQQTVRVEGSEATLYRGLLPAGSSLPEQIDGFDQIATGTVDEQGSVVLDIPATEPLEGDGSETLALHLVVDGHDYWYRHAMEPADAPTMALTLDRPLYQPGQTMKMRTVVVSATTGRPIDGGVRWQIHDPRGNLVFEQDDPTGANGVGSVDFTLADRCVQGAYRITATHGASSVTKMVEVRPFRLPRFTVDVDLAAATVGPGESLPGQVNARYTYGEPVVDADVSVTATAAGMQLTGASGKTTESGLFDFDLDVPADATPGTPIEFAATVTSAAGRAEGGAASARVEGRTLTVDVVPAARKHFVWDSEQAGYLIVTDEAGEPVAGLELAVSIPEKEKERDVTVTTDERGRAEFRWRPTPAASSYLSVSFELDDRKVDLNLRPDVQYGQVGLKVSTSVTRVGESLDVSVGANHGEVVALVRDGVALAAQQVAAQGGTLTFDVPAASAGLAHVVLLGEGSVVDSIPIWIRQRGGDAVEISTDQPEYRPGRQAKVSLSFPPPEDSSPDAPGVTFGLVGVDEALYALKERADVPLHVLLRRAPETIDAALRAFDGVDEDDAAGVAIATSRFRQRVPTDGAAAGSAHDVSSDFQHHRKRPWLLGLMWLWLLGGIATIVQMVRWTWRSSSKEVFSWRRALGQFGFAVLAAIFAIALAAVGQGEAWGGGLAVWIAVVACWWIAAAARLPELPFGRWLAAHVLGVAFLGGAGACVEELARGSSDIGDWFIIGGVVVPLLLAGIQWIIWAFVLMHHGERRSALGLASLVGVFTLGLSGFVMLASGAGSAPMMAKADMAVRQEEPTAPPPSTGVPEPELKRRNQPLEGAPDGDPAAEEPRVRSWFPETMVWLPELAAGDDGTASVDVELPDSITTWRLNAWANSSDGRFGQGEAALRVVKPYFVELDLPTEVIEGDRFEVPVTLVNRTDEPLAVDFVARAEGALSLRGGEAESAELAPAERRIVWLELSAEAVGEGSVTVSSTTDRDGDGDAVRRTLNVSPDGRTLRDSASGIIGDGWSDEVVIPRDAIRGTSVAEVRVFASLVADAIAGLSSMIRRPTGCFEQTSSVNYPNIMILRALDDTDPEKWPDGAEAWQEAHDEATQMVRLGYQRILTFQRPAGGFALYPDHDPDVMLTAYGILQLVWAKDVTTVDDAVIRNAANWLVNQQNDNGGWPVERRGVASWRASDDVGRVRATSFAALALLATDDDRWNAPVERALDRIEKRVVSVESANALAYAANALSAGDRDDAAKKAVDRLAAMATREGDVAYWSTNRPTWMGGSSVYASRETTAIAAQALLETQTEAQLLQPVLNWISGERSSYGGWGTTQATVWTLRVLETLRERSSERAVLEFTFAGESMETGLADPFVVESGPQPLRQFDFVPRGYDGVFGVEASAETTAMVQLVSEYAVPWESRHSEVDDEPFGALLELDSRDLRRGRTTRAILRIENDDANPVNMTIVEAPVPPGAFVNSSSLDRLKAAGKIDAYEILPTHIRFYVTTVPAETERVWAYEFVPLVAGTFSMPPVRAYPFYSPEPMTEVDAGDVGVE